MVNKGVFIICFPKLRVQGLAIYPFIFLQNKNLCRDEKIINHEMIHIRQQLELLILPFYILYILNLAINYFVYRNIYSAYRNIVFEQEAYENDSNLNYLKNRKFATWLCYLNKCRKS
jgi:hypothetical protein